MYAHHGHHASLELSRAEFDELTADLLERTRVTTKLVLNEAGLEWPEVDKLLLSGGSTRMPQVARMLRDLSGQEPDRSISPDEAVAHGAALYHGILQADAQWQCRGGRDDDEGRQRQRAQPGTGHPDPLARPASIPRS